jgi:hypothetical protein
MSAFKNLTDIGLTGGSPRYNPSELQAQWGLNTSIDKTILLTFGGLGLQQIPYDNLQHFLIGNSSPLIVQP